MKNLFFLVCLMLFGGITIAQNDNNRETKVEPTETDIDRDFENYLARYIKAINGIGKSRSNSATKRAEVLRMADAIIKKYGHVKDDRNELEKELEASPMPRRPIAPEVMPNEGKASPRGVAPSSKTSGGGL